MPDLPFPFWAVSQWYDPLTVPVTLPGVPGCLAVFTTAEMAAAFMTARGQTEFTLRAVDRPSFHAFVRSVQPFDVRYARVDPAPRDDHPAPVAVAGGRVDIAALASRLTECEEDGPSPDVSGSRPEPDPGVGSEPAGRLLVVEDHPDGADALVLLAQLAGFDCRTVGDGRFAALAAAEFGPDVVLLDVDLPGVDGFAVARELARLRQPPAVAFVSGAVDPPADLTSLGASRFFRKPADPAELFDWLRQVCGRRV